MKRTVREYRLIEAMRDAPSHVQLAVVTMLADGAASDSGYRKVVANQELASQLKAALDDAMALGFVKVIQATSDSITIEIP